MPAYNVGPYIAEAIQSVINQTYDHWELLVINDGSTDNTESIIFSFNDVRIRYYSQKNKGVGAARNLGLKHKKGDFLCFLDGDDFFPPESLQSRLKVLEANPSVDYVDGIVTFKNEDLRTSLRQHVPAFKGFPYEQLLRLNGACLFGNTWMVRIKPDIQYHFNEKLTHAEDLYFYLSIAKMGGQYSFVDQEILWYRQRPTSAMKDLKGLEIGYQKLYQLVKKELKVSKTQLLYLKYKITRIMFASYLKGQKDVYNAMRSVFRNITL